MTRAPLRSGLKPIGDSVGSPPSFVHKRLGGHVGVGRGTKANSAPPRGPGYTREQGGCQGGRGAGGVTVIVKLHTTYGGARPTRYLSTYRVCEHRGGEGGGGEAIRSRRLPSIGGEDIGQRSLSRQHRTGRKQNHIAGGRIISYRPRHTS